MGFLLEAGAQAVEYFFWRRFTSSEAEKQMTK
jgi:hypothetical protein